MGGTILLTNTRGPVTILKRTKNCGGATGPGKTQAPPGERPANASSRINHNGPALE